MSNNILRFKKDGKYVPVDVNAENVLLKNQAGEYTGENLENLLGDYHNLEQNYTPRLNTLEQNDAIAEQKANELTAQLAQKVERGEVSVSDINKNKGLLDESYFTDATKEQWTGNSPVTMTPTPLGVTTQKISNKAVTGEKTDFINMSSNLFDKSDVTKGYTVNSATGELFASSGVEVSGFIPVSPNAQYTDKAIAKRAYYDDTFNFISAVTLTGGTFTTPANCYYLRLVVYTVNAVPAQLNIGSVALPYEQFHKKLVGVGISADDIVDGKLSVSILADNSIGVGQVDFIEESKNLVDERSIKRSHQLDSQTGELIDGVYHVTDFITVKPSTTFTTNFGSRIYYYGIDKEFIRSQGVAPTEIDPLTFTTGVNDYHIRIVDSPVDRDRMFNEGNEILPYHPFFRRLKGSNTSAESETNEEKRYRLVNDDLYIYNGSVEGVYTSETIPTHETLYTTNHTDVYEWYDSLMAEYPSYITKKKLGENTLGNPVYQYDFKPHEVENITTYRSKKIKFILVSGVHGEEKAGVLNLFNTLEAITKKWQDSELLETLRHNTHFVIIPIVCVHGYDNTSRKNENGVDIARNFPTEWVYEADKNKNTYGGESPLSELDSQLLDQVFKDNKDAMFFTSHHNYFSAQGTNDFVWHAAATYLQLNIAKNLISRLSRKWKAERSYLPQGEDVFLGYSTVTSPKGSEGMHATSYGMQGGTFEISQNIPSEPGNVNFSSGVLTMGVEALVNFLVLNLKHNVDYYNRK